MFRGNELLAEVAAILEAANWKVLVELGREGIKVDIFAVSPNGEEVVIECKAYSQLAGLRTIREFASTMEFLRESNERLAGWLVTTQGFTPNAQKALDRHRLVGRTVDELRTEYGATQESTSRLVSKFLSEAQRKRKVQKRVFVIMPFSAEMLDVFVLGIRWTANEVGAIAERADDLEHNGEILSEIRRAIGEYDAIVADTTGANPNVCYEVGYAHALRRPTVLICKQGEKLPFDLQGTNHLMYPNFLNLRDPLKKKLAACLSEGEGTA